MQISKLEVKNISYYERGSEETPCYNATVYLNGKKAIEVSNDGRGGMDFQHQYNLGDNGIVKEANEWCIKKFGTKTIAYKSEGKDKSFSVNMDLEHVCQDALYDWLDKKTLKKDMVKRWLISEDNQLHQYKKLPILPPHTKEGMENHFKVFLNKNHPKAKCLNFMTFEEALKIYKELG